MQLKIYIRHQQMYSLYGVAGFYSGANPQNLVFTPGQVSSNTWIDVTKYVTDLDKFTLTFTMQTDDSGNNPGTYQPKKVVANSISLEGFAYDYIRDWLWNDVAAPLNAIEVKIVDSTCGEYTGLSIKNTDTTYCEDNICTFDVTVKQKDPLWACIEQTVIYDNWQGWFQPQPANGKMHPRFSYCVEQRPNGILIALWFILALFFPVYLIFSLVIDIIGTIVQVILNILNVLASIASFISFGTINISFNYNPLPTLGNLPDEINFYTNVFGELSGCSREHPAPLIRDYISNVCDKCGIAYGAASIPIFFSPTITTSVSNPDQQITNVNNPHYNACYMSATVKRGIRRIRNNDIFNGPVPDTTTFWIDENKPILALDQFLNQLKGGYNSEWRIKYVNNVPTLFFQRKDFFQNATPLYDFSTGGADRDKLLIGLCFEWNELQLPAYCNGIYQQDAIDTCGNEALDWMNGIANFDQTDNNPNYYGALDKTQPFGATKFRLDGALANDALMDAMQFIASSEFIMTPLSLGGVNVLLAQLTTYLNHYGDYALLMRDEISQLPKILIWDNTPDNNGNLPYLNAKAIKDMNPVNNNLPNGNLPIPMPNGNYPVLQPNAPPAVFISETWAQLHEFVGINTILGTINDTGTYFVTDFFGNTIYSAPARLCNYPMYFEPHFKGTLWDWFHWIDDPKKNPTMRMNWTANIQLCCEDIQICGLDEDGTGAQLLETVLLPIPYYNKGIIKQFKLSYDSTNQYGKLIEIQGTC